MRRTVPQTDWIYNRLSTILEAAGSSLGNIVRLDQFFATRGDKPGYFPVRRAHLRENLPVSAALEMSGLLVPDAGVQVDSYAIIPNGAFVKEAINTDNAPRVVVGHSMAVRAGDWIWTSGATPTDLKVSAEYSTAPDGLADEARANPNYNYDYPITKQAQYVIKKLKAYLQAAGSDLDRVVKMQAYLTDMTDLFDFMQVFEHHFPENPPALLVAPLTRVGVLGGRLEVSVVALSSDSTIERVVVSVPNGHGTLGPYPEAVRAGNLLFLSGQVAVDSYGLHPDAQVNPQQPYLKSPAKQQMQVIVDNIARVCEAAGGSIDSTVKAVLFFRDLADVAPAMEVWGAAFGDIPPAISIVQTTAEHLVPGATITADVYAAI
jgi:enamine deaminase RidA (YjgF/YER057c/UK114 family)